MLESILYKDDVPVSVLGSVMFGVAGLLMIFWPMVRRACAALVARWWR